jgi:hypothetical protein
VYPFHLAVTLWHKFLACINMENENKLQEQEAPLKNNDNAFVQVGKDGKPVMPQNDEMKSTHPEDDGGTTSLDRR